MPPQNQSPVTVLPSEPQSWHLDPRVSVANIVSTVTLIISVVWFFSEQDKRIAGNALSIKHNAQSIERNSQAMNAQEIRFNRSVDAILAKLDKLTDVALEANKN